MKNKPALTEELLGDLRAELEAENDSLSDELASHGKQVGGDWEGNTGGLSGEEADPTDAADTIEELVTNVPLVEELERRQKEVRAALLRMDNGEYGLCSECKTPIDEDRLKANPAAATCIEHA